MSAKHTPKLLPCPMCGNRLPFTHITFSCAVIRCDCGVELSGASVCVMYRRDELPMALERFTYEPELLSIQRSDGSVLTYPDHGYVGVNAEAAFALYGHTARWNRRATGAAS